MHQSVVMVLLSFMAIILTATYPSVGAGWVITNEEFMKDQKVFSNLKTAWQLGP
jgi:hypothetical protein